MKKFLIAFVIGLAILPSMSFAKGYSGGGRSYSSSSYSSSRSYSAPSSSYSTKSYSSPSSTSYSTKSYTTPSTKSYSSPSAKSYSSTPTTPSVTKTPTSSTAKVTTPTAKVVNGSSYGKTGYVVGSGYQPKFKGGYTAPAGSVVYYRESSMMDWLPFYLILNSQNAHRQAVVVEPAKDGASAKTTVVKEEGVDTMYVVNWIVTILIVGGIIALIVYKVDKNAKKKKKYVQDSY